MKIQFKNGIPHITANKFSKSDLPEVCGLSKPTIIKEIDNLLSEPAIAKEFGEYKFNRFSQKQIDILVENLSFLDHLKGLRYE